MEVQHRDHIHFFTICVVRKDGLVGYDGRFTRGRSRVRFPIFVCTLFILLALLLGGLVPICALSWIRLPIFVLSIFAGLVWKG